MPAIAEIKAIPVSVPVTGRDAVTLGIGRMVKRDAVLVKVTTDDGVTGWGEAHHGRSPGAVAHLVNTTLRQLVVGMDADDVVGVWKRIYSGQLASHGMGAACAIGMSGIDIALWDARGKAAGLPLYKLLGGGRREIPAYAGGVSLGYGEPSEVVAEVHERVSHGYQAVKLRVGDSPERDARRVTRVREELGDGLVILTDANTNYRLADVRTIMPVLAEAGVEWLEEPFPAHDYRQYEIASRFGNTPLAAGENHYTRFEFTRLVDGGSVQILQPDVSKCGGITEAVRIAALASAWKLPICPHTSSTGLNMAASLHLLAAIDNGGYFEGDATHDNPLRTALTSKPYTLTPEGNVSPPERPGVGVTVDEEFLDHYPVIEGPAFV